MRGGKAQFAVCLAVALLAGLLAEPALAQRGFGQGRKSRQPQRGQGVRPQPDRQPGVRPGPGKGPRRDFRASPGVPPQWMERLQRMTPADQERFLNNNERFRSLPPERQSEIRERLRRWNSLSPQEQNALRQREEVWRRMSAEQRRRVREEILPKWRQLEPERRQALRRRLGALTALDDAERAARLNDENFLQGLSPEERELLRALAQLRLPPPEPHEPPHQEPPPY